MYILGILVQICLCKKINFKSTIFVFDVDYFIITIHSFALNINNYIFIFI